MTGETCPDIFEVEDGYAVIGRLDATHADDKPQWDAFLGEGEAVVIIPRRVLMDAARQLLSAELNKLTALEAGGVDNWEGYSYAMSLRSEEEEE